MSQQSFAVVSVAGAIAWGVFFYPPPPAVPNAPAALPAAPPAAEPAAASAPLPPTAPSDIAASPNPGAKRADPLAKVALAPG